MEPADGAAKRDRVLAALRGEAVDRLPISFWGHNRVAESSARGLADETLRLYRTYDWDYLKPQPRSEAIAEMWGLTFVPSDRPDLKHAITRYPVQDTLDLARIRPVDPRGGALGEQIEALRLLRAGVGPDVPIVWTVLSPLMAARYLLAGGIPQLLEAVRTAPSALERALEALTETLVAYARACLEAGADGLFFPTDVARQGALTLDEVQCFQRPYDLRVLAVVESAWFNVLHVCGAQVYFDAFADYPVAAHSWAPGDGNPTLAEGHRLTGRAVLGGLPAGSALAALTAGETTASISAMDAEMGGRWLLLGPSCAIQPTRSEVALQAARSAVSGSSAPVGRQNLSRGQAARLQM